MYFEAYKKASLASEHPTQTEYRLFAEITRELETANSEAGTTSDRINAVFRNSQLWLALKVDLMSEKNQLDNPTKAGLISLAIWIEKITGPAMKGGMDLTPFISINMQIMHGLSKASRTARTEITSDFAPELRQAIA